MNKTDYLYLDHAATSPMREVAFDAYKLAEQNGFANSSGGHALSRNAKNMLEDARDFVASCFGAAPSEITFTSSGTEADNWIIKTPFLNLDSKDKHIITSQIEHEAILGSAEWNAGYGVNVDYIPPTREGVINIESFKSKLTSNTDLVSFMYANNETGILQPIPINMSAQTSSLRTQQTIQDKLEKRSRTAYGPPAGKKIAVFVDDINMPAVEEYGAQPPIELLRLFIDK